MTMANDRLPAATALARSPDADRLRAKMRFRMDATRMKGELLASILGRLRCPACGASCVYNSGGFVCRADSTHMARAAATPDPALAAKEATLNMMLMEARSRSGEARSDRPADGPPQRLRAIVLGRRHTSD